MRDDKDEPVVSDDDDDDEIEVSFDDEDVQVNTSTGSERTKNSMAARRKLELMRERKELRARLGDDWSDDVLGEDI